MQFGNIFTPIRSLMREPLKVAAALAFSFSALSGSAPAFAGTTTITDGILSDNGIMYFLDDRLNSNNSTHPGFAFFSGVQIASGIYQYTLMTYIDLYNPYDFNPNADIKTFGFGRGESTERGYLYTYGYNHISNPRYGSERDSNYGFFTGADSVQSVGFRAEADKTYFTDATKPWRYYWGEYDWDISQYNNITWTDFERGGEARIVDSYTYLTYWTLFHSHRSEDGNISYSSVPSEYMIELLSSLPGIPVSGYGVFDFENSFVFYAGESEGVSLTQLLENIMNPSLDNGGSFEFGEIVGSTYYCDTSNLLINFSSDREIVGISLAYNLNTPAIPEPETWAMLLAGLGIVGVAAKRRRRQG